MKYKEKVHEQSYVERNYNHIKSWQDVRQSNYTRFEVRKSLDESFNSVHLGVQILSYSKRIMNQVLATAEDIGVKAFYTDTDSMMSVSYTHLTLPTICSV